MKFGCALIVRGKHATQENLLTLAKQAEAWGFDSLWASDHVILPPLRTSRYPGAGVTLLSRGTGGNRDDQTERDPRICRAQGDMVNPGASGDHD
jgi:hypothetical protein